MASFPWSQEALRLRGALANSEQALTRCQKIIAETHMSLAETQVILLKTQNRSSQLEQENRSLQEALAKSEDYAKALQNEILNLRVFKERFEADQKELEEGSPSQSSQGLRHPNKQVWQYEVRDGEWKDYHASVQDKLSSHFATSRLSGQELMLDVTGTEEQAKYKIRLSSDIMYQENPISGTVRLIRRVELQQPGIHNPSYWAKDAPGHGAYAHDLDPTSSHWKEVAKQFHNTCGESRYKIFNIQYVQAAERWTFYATKRAKWFQHLGSKLNEQMLWHGTNLENLEEIANQGFLRQYTKRAVYGDGCYFAKEAYLSASTGYSTLCKDNFQRLILSRVLVGESEIGHSGMKIPNKKPMQKRVYESTVNHLSNPSIFVIYQDDQAYPEFIVTFQRADLVELQTPVNVLPPPAASGVFARPHIPSTSPAPVSPNTSGPSPNFAGSPNASGPSLGGFNISGFSNSSQSVPSPAWLANLAPPAQAAHAAQAASQAAQAAAQAAQTASQAAQSQSKSQNPSSQLFY